MVKENRIKCPVVEKQQDLYKVKINNTIFTAQLKGRLLYKIQDSGQFPCVGDIVVVNQYENLVIIEEIIDRKSKISRKVAGRKTNEQVLAANIDFVFVVLGLDGGRNYSDRLLERYMTIAWESGATPVVILNKADLNEDAEFVKSQAEYIAPGVDIIVTSAKNGKGIPSINQLLTRGKIGVFIGPSGVGKSALTNILIKEDLQKTGEQRKQDKRGRHTTSASIMYEIDDGGFIIDSPGLREIQLWAGQQDIETVFQEISSIAKNCKFNDCQHNGEPGCAVQEAIGKDLITPDRYNSYLELKKEIAYLKLKKSEKRIFLERQQNKRFTKDCKKMMKEKKSMKKY